MIGVDDGLLNGNLNLADVLFLIAAFLFLIAGLLAWTKRPDPSSGALVPFGLTLVAVAWLVL